MFMTKTIITNLLKKYSTRLHPFEQRVLPEGFRGRFKFAIDKCILCRQCVMKCPTQVISIDPEKGIWHREVMGCLYCGVCADVCPTGCITMTNVYRPPITEPAFLTFNVPPRPKKAKAKSQEEIPTPDEIQAALERKIADDETKPAVSHMATTEEEAVTTLSQAADEAAHAAQAARDKQGATVSVKKKK